MLHKLNFIDSREENVEPTYFVIVKETPAKYHLDMISYILTFLYESRCFAYEDEVYDLIIYLLEKLGYTIITEEDEKCEVQEITISF